MANNRTNTIVTKERTRGLVSGNRASQIGIKCMPARITGIKKETRPISRGIRDSLKNCLIRRTGLVSLKCKMDSPKNHQETTTGTVTIRIETRATITNIRSFRDEIQTLKEVLAWVIETPATPLGKTVIPTATPIKAPKITAPQISMLLKTQGTPTLTGISPVDRKNLHIEIEAFLIKTKTSPPRTMAAIKDMPSNQTDRPACLTDNPASLTGYRNLIGRLGFLRLRRKAKTREIMTQEKKSQDPATESKNPCSRSIRIRIMNTKLTERHIIQKTRTGNKRIFYSNHLKTNLLGSQMTSTNSLCY